MWTVYVKNEISVSDLVSQLAKQTVTHNSARFLISFFLQQFRILHLKVVSAEITIESTISSLLPSPALSSPMLSISTD